MAPCWLKPLSTIRGIPVGARNQHGGCGHDNGNGHSVPSPFPIGSPGLPVSSFLIARYQIFAFSTEGSKGVQDHLL